MNTETGQIYRGKEEIRKARERGEPLREMTEEEVKEMKRREAKTRERDAALSSMKPLPRGYKDRSGSKPKLRRSKVRAKNKAARKARKANR